MVDPGASAHSAGAVQVGGGDDALRHLTGEAHCTSRVRMATNAVKKYVHIAVLVSNPVFNTVISLFC
jgi:hypothetical protein